MSTCSSVTAYILLIHFLQLPLFAHPISFNFPSFVQGAGDILYEGDAVPLNGAIELITTLDFFSRVGRASYANGIRLWDSSTQKLADFTTHFIFTSKDNSTPSLGDGMAFFVAPVDDQIPPNSAGGHLGLFNSTTSTSRQIVVVEFDSFPNKPFDPPMRHVGINNCSMYSAVYVNWDIDTRIGQEANVWITYNASTKNLSVFLTYDSDPVFLGNSTLSYNINLMEVLPEWVRIGFSSATGAGVQRTTIYSWQFNSSLDSNKPEATEEKMRKTIAAVASGTTSFCLVMLALGITYFMIRRKKAKNAVRNGQEIATFAADAFDLEKGTFPRRFSYQELVAATNNFADNMRLGRGGSGHVYKGILNDLVRHVAVKRIFPDSANSEKIFMNEVKIISRLIHRNLVQFIGWCHEKGRFLLVYEYMPEGSLDAHLFGDRKSLPWQVRYRIALDLAFSLHYLHEGAEQCVLHRDIKSANVLLGTDFTTKLGDFGVAKLVDPRLRTQTTGVVGTFGYLAPEYVNEGRASKESDVFGFGIVALEIACGRRTYWDGDVHVPLARWVWNLYNIEGNVLKAADERLGMEFDREEMERLLMVGLWCTSPKDKQRPKAVQIIKVLQGEAPPLTQLPSDMHDPTSPTPLQQQNLPVDFTGIAMSSSLDHQGR